MSEISRSRNFMYSKQICMLQNHRTVHRFVTHSEEFCDQWMNEVGLKWRVHFSFIKPALQVHRTSYLTKIPNYEILYHKIASMLFSCISNLRILFSTLFPKIITHQVTQENRLTSIDICRVLIFPVYALKEMVKYFEFRRTYNFYFVICL